MQLSLNSNNIGAGGAKLVAAALAGGMAPCVMQVFMGDNNIGAEGAKLVAVAMSEGGVPSRMQWLWLGVQPSEVQWERELPAEVLGGDWLKVARYLEKQQQEEAGKAAAQGLAGLLLG
eukprot:2152864-Rhodomonas_salina.1